MACLHPRPGAGGVGAGTPARRRHRARAVRAVAVRGDARAGREGRVRVSPD